MLPKVGKVRVKQHREIPAGYQLKSVTVSQTQSGTYYASILFEYENQVQEQMPTTFLGLDYSMRELYKDSNGNEPSYPRYYRQAEKKLAREGRRLSKMQSSVVASITDRHITSDLAIRTLQKALDSQHLSGSDSAQRSGKPVYIKGFHRIL